MKPWSTLCRFATGLLVLSCLPVAPVQAQAEEPAGHCLLLPLAPAERARQAKLVVEGEVLDARSFWDNSHHRIAVLRLELTDLMSVHQFAENAMARVPDLTPVNYLFLNAGMAKEAGPSSHKSQWCDTQVVNQLCQ